MLMVDYGIKIYIGGDTADNDRLCNQMCEAVDEIGEQIEELADEIVAKLNKIRETAGVGTSKDITSQFII